MRMEMVPPVKTTRTCLRVTLGRERGAAGGARRAAGGQRGRAGGGGGGGGRGGGGAGGGGGGAGTEGEAGGDAGRVPLPPRPHHEAARQSEDTPSRFRTNR